MPVCPLANWSTATTRYTMPIPQIRVLLNDQSSHSTSPNRKSNIESITHLASEW